MSAKTSKKKQSAAAAKDQQDQSTALYEQIMNSGVELAEYTAATVLRAYLVARTQSAEEARKIEPTDSTYYERACARYAAFLQNEEKLKGGRKTIFPLTDKDRYNVLYCGSNVLNGFGDQADKPRIECPNGRTPSTHRDNVLLIVDGKTVSIFYAVVRDWQKGTLLRLNKAENYAVCAFLILQETEMTNTTRKALMALYTVFDKYRRPHLLKMSTAEIHEYYETRAEGGDVGEIKLGDMRMPTSLVLESEETMSVLADNLASDLPSVFVARSMPNKRAPKSKKTEASSSSSSSTEPKAAATKPDAAIVVENPKPKKRQRKAKPATTTTANAESGLMHARIAESVRAILHDADLATQRAVYSTVFADHVLDRNAKRKAPKSHTHATPSKQEVATQRMYPEGVDAMTLAERLTSGVFQVMAGINNSTTRQFTQAQERAQTHAEFEGDKIDHASRLMIRPLGPHYIGSSKEPVKVQTTRQLYIQFFTLALQVARHVTATVERAAAARMADCADGVADQFLKMYQELIAERDDKYNQMKHEVTELRRTLSTTDTQLAEFKENHEERAAKLTQKLAKRDATIKSLRGDIRALKMDRDATRRDLEQLRAAAKPSSSSSSLTKSRKRKLGHDEVHETLRTLENQEEEGDDENAEEEEEEASSNMDDDDAEESSAADDESDE